MGRTVISVCKIVRSHLKALVLLLVFIVTLFNLYVQSAWAMPQVQDIKAESAILVECERGQVLYAKQAEKRLHISSMCKLMTALIAIEKSSLGAKVTISKDSARSEGSLLLLESGEKYSVEDLLYSIMLISANDSAVALAEFVGGDVDKFVDMMNNKAHELNLKDTQFRNPTGLYNDEQYTTANDIAVFMKYALKNQTFNMIFSTNTKLISGKNTSVLINLNKLFWSYDRVDGGKAGYNDIEQQTAITTASMDTQRLLSIVLNSPAQSVYSDSSKLLDYGFQNFRRGILITRDIPLKSIQVEGKTVNLVSINDVYYTYPAGEDYIKSVEFKINGNLTPPITRDRVLGTVRYTLKDKTAIEVNLYPDTEILPRESLVSLGIKKITGNRDIFILISFLLFLEVVLIISRIGKLFRRNTIGK